MPSHPTLTVLSLGGGVHSSVKEPIAGEGTFDRVPDSSIFADTHWEPPSVYEHLIEWLAGWFPFPVYAVDKGHSLHEDVKAFTNHSCSRSYVNIPVYFKGRDGHGDGIGRRQWITNYKVRPIRLRIRKLLGLQPQQRVPATTTVEMWLGISTDEAILMNISRERWMTNRYPLFEAWMSRRDCADWWAGRYTDPWNSRRASPVHSSHDVGGWRPSAGGRSCSQRLSRSTLGCGTAWPSTGSRTCTCCGCPWMRPSEWTTRSLSRRACGQGDRFGNECEGHCGV